MNKNKENIICEALQIRASKMIIHAAELRHCERSPEFARAFLVEDLKEIVAAAAFFGVTLKNVKVKMKDYAEWLRFKTSEQQF